MGLEIEHKFLVRARAWRAAVRGSRWLRQGYLANNSRCSVRVRVADDAAWMSVKQMIAGTARAEYEYAIDRADADAMLQTLCEPPLIEKRRHEVPHGQHLWEIDEFAGDNAGLIMAEIELASEAEPFDRPEWLGLEVTHDRRFYNFSLATHPWREFAAEFEPTTDAGVRPLS
jgi:adenylate cyclase